MQRYETYKDSGVEWIGEIPAGWHTDILFRAARILGSGCTPSTDVESNYDGDIPWLQVCDLGKGRVASASKCISESALSKHSVLSMYSAPFLAIAMYASIGSISFVQRDSCVNQAICAISAGQLELRYLYYALKCAGPSMLADGVGGTQKNISQQYLRKIKLPVPSFDEQQAIADYLDGKTAEIDSIVFQTERSIELLREYRKSVISEAVTKGLDPDAPMKDSSVEWIGEIPAGWEIVKSRYVIEDITDIDHWMPDSVDAGYPYVAISDLKPRSSLIAFTDCKQISKSDFQKLSLKSMPRKGDVILARYATIGTSCLVDSDEPFVVSYSCVTVTPRDERLDGRYFDYWLKSEPCGRELDRFTKSNTQGNVGKESLFQMKMILPPMSTQRRIADYLDAKTAEIDSLIADKQRQVELLKEYRKSLISEAVTGKFKVPGLE